MAKKRRVKKVTEEEEENVKKLPIGVQIISVLYYISAILCAVFGIMFISASGYLASMIPELEGFGAGLFIFLGIILVGFGVLGFFIGMGLWKLKSWARIVAVVFAVLGVLLAIYSMIKAFNIGDIVNLLINGIMGAYLIFSKEAKRAFK